MEHFGYSLMLSNTEEDMHTLVLLTLVLLGCFGNTPTATEEHAPTELITGPGLETISPWITTRFNHGENYTRYCGYQHDSSSNLCFLTCGNKSYSVGMISMTEIPCTSIGYTPPE